MRKPDVCDMIAMYNGGATVKDVGKAVGVSTGKAFYMLRDAGCVFRRSGHPKGTKRSAESVEKTRQALLGRKVSPETRRKMSDARRVHYNGLNGYGHTKPGPNGYVLAYVPEHPRAHTDGYVFLHTVIMERLLGRYLEENEVVHHVNHIKDDNSAGNLRLMNRKQHMSMHMRERNEAKRSGNY